VAEGLSKKLKGSVIGAVIDAVHYALDDAVYGALRLPLRLMPLWMEAIGAGVFMATTVQGHPRFKERLKEVAGKVFLFEASDIEKSFYLKIKEDEIKVIPYMTCEPDVVMRGEARVLMNLLLGREDPDTVFFTRRLEINGDTAAAILFKNILADL
jgi:predicted lipid carrier protein YhbT